jgi:hypothetical protein
MKSVWSVPLTLALFVGGAGLAQAQQPYPSQFAERWSSSCMASCQNNTLYKSRPGTCASYCGCVVQEVQAKVPLEVAMQADKDLAAKNNQSEAVQRVNQVVHQCQSRVAAPAPSNTVRR